MGRNHRTQSLFDNIVLNTSCCLVATVLKVKNGMTIWGQNGCEYSVVSPHDHWLGGPGAATGQPPERGLNHVSLTQKRSKFKIQSTVSTECGLFLHHRKVKKS